MSDARVLIQESIAKNKALLQTLSKTDYAPPALEQHKVFLDDLKRALERSKRELAAHDRKVKAEHEDHEKISSSNFRKFLFKATGQGTKFVEKASKEEREYFEALQKFHEEEKVNRNLISRVAEAEKVLEELENVAKLNSDTQRQLDDLYLSVFSGPTPQFPGDDERENKTNAALQSYRVAKIAAEAESQVVQMLTSAATSMRISLRAMDDSLSASRMDIFGAGSWADMMERDALAVAERNVYDAKMMVMQAQRFSPHVGNFPRVNFVQQSFLGDVVFDNIFSDLAMHDKLKEGAMGFQKVSAWVQEQLKQAQGRRDIAIQDLKQRESELNDARKDLQKFRESVFEMVANDQPPPRYEP
jgi:hypothetical protein